MDPTATYDGEKSPSHFTRCLETIRGRLDTLFSGSSIITSRHKLAMPRIGLQLLVNNLAPRSESHLPTHHTRRTDSSAVSDLETSFDEPFRPGPAHGTLGPRPAPSEERRRTRRSGHRRRRTARGRRRHPQAAWVRSRRGSQKTSGAQRFCLGPGLRTREARRKMIDCAVSATLLTVVLVIYLTLAFSSTVTAREFHVLMILALMLLTIYLCHSLIRLFMIASRRFSGDSEQRRIVRKIGSFGYAQPQQPIPVTLARDEENAMGDDLAHDATEHAPVAKPPPAYGRWRTSVRINPNMIYWQRIDKDRHPNSKKRQQNEDNDPPQASQNRPPSYISDDGVQYVVDVQPEHPTGHQLRDPAEQFIHPAERGQAKI